MSENHIPIYGTADRKLADRGSRDGYLGPPEYAREGWEAKIKRGLPDHDIILRQRTRFVVFFHKGPPSRLPKGQVTNAAEGRVCAGSVERAKICGDRFPERQPAYVMDVMTGRCFEVWGKAAALGPIK